MLNGFQRCLSLGFVLSPKTNLRPFPSKSALSQSACFLLCFLTSVIKLYYYSLTKPYPSIMENVSIRRIRNGATEKVLLT